MVRATSSLPEPDPPMIMNAAVGRTNTLNGLAKRGHCLGRADQVLHVRAFVLKFLNLFFQLGGFKRPFGNKQADGQP